MIVFVRNSNRSISDYLVSREGHPNGIMKTIKNHFKQYLIKNLMKCIKKDFLRHMNDKSVSKVNTKKLF